MSQQKTLVVILCMHRSGSSLAARLLQRLGMSLGPFDLGEINESNKYGHFEAQPFVLLNREFQLREFGFEGDLPESDDVFGRYRECGGRWTSEEAISDEEIGRGRDLVERLMQSGTVCGFKDPRTVQTWPYWRRVFASMDGLRIVPLFLVRNPHEIAMSIFRRSQGMRDYGQALDVTAVHFRRMREIRDQWPGDSAVVNFDPAVHEAQFRLAAELCGLDWSDAAFAEVYDAACRHHLSAAIDHPAHAAFDALRGTSAGWTPASVEQSGNGFNSPSCPDDRQLRADAAAREAMLHHYRVLTNAERDSARQERDAAREKVAELWGYIGAMERTIATIPPLQAQLAQTSQELELIQNSRTWRVRETLVRVLGRRGGDHREFSINADSDRQEAESSANGMH
jgi:hypothetical protein